jgi:hypothetical protein
MRFNVMVISHAYRPQYPVGGYTLFISLETLQPDWKPVIRQTPMAAYYSDLRLLLIVLKSYYHESKCTV